MKYSYRVYADILFVSVRLICLALFSRLAFFLLLYIHGEAVSLSQHHRQATRQSHTECHWKKEGAWTKHTRTGREHRKSILNLGYDLTEYIIFSWLFLVPACCSTHLCSKVAIINIFYISCLLWWLTEQHPLSSQSLICSFSSVLLFSCMWLYCFGSRSPS